MLAGVMLFLGAPSVVPIGLLRRNLHFAQVAFLDLGSFALGVGFSNVAAAFSLLVVSWLMLGKSRPAIMVRGCIGESWSLARRGASLTGVELLNYFGLNLDKILLGRYAGPVALGHYTRAYALSIQPATQVLSPIGAIIIPSLSRLRDNEQAYRNFFERMYSVTLLFSVPLAATIIVLSHDLFYLLMGPGWEDAASIASWLGIMLFTKPCASVIYWMFLTRDNNPMLLKWSIWNALINIITFVVAVQYGVHALAARYALAGLVIRNPLAFWFTGKLNVMSVWFLVKVYLQSIVAFAVVLVLLYYCREAVSAQTIWLRLIVCLSAIAAMTVLLVMGSRDGRWLFSVAFQKVKKFLRK
jgi:O-antigen/teichoic acid export membrane protein